MRNHNVRFPDEVLAQMREAAREDERSLNSEIVYAVKVFLDTRVRNPAQNARTGRPDPQV